MENHADREEIETARTAKYGVSVRGSATTGRNMLYVATRLSDGSFLRLADTYPSALAGFVSFLPALLVAAAVAFAITLVLADRFAKSITGPIEELSDSLKLVRSGGAALQPDRYQYDELQDMAADINQLSAEVDENLASLKKERARIDYVLDNMSEGLILLDAEETGAHHQPGGLRLSGLRQVGDGQKHHLRHPAHRLYRRGGRGGAGRRRRRGWRCRCPAAPWWKRSVSPVAGRGAAADGRGGHRGALGRHHPQNAVRMRQEFFSNASHELKTPITSIRGFAELSVPRPTSSRKSGREFARRILKEAGTMQNLISDIIMISRLESGDITFEREVLDLAEVVRDCCADAKPAAEQKGTP